MFGFHFFICNSVDIYEEQNTIIIVNSLNINLCYKSVVKWGVDFFVAFFYLYFAFLCSWRILLNLSCFGHILGHILLIITTIIFVFKKTKTVETLFVHQKNVSDCLNHKRDGGGGVCSTLYLVRWWANIYVYFCVCMLIYH